MGSNKSVVVSCSTHKPMLKTADSKNAVGGGAWPYLFSVYSKCFS